MLQKHRSEVLKLRDDGSHPDRRLSRFTMLQSLTLTALFLCATSASTQGLRAVPTAIPVFPGTQVAATAQQNVMLEVTGSPTSISSFSFTTTQGGVAEYTVGTVTGCVVDGSTLNPVGTICNIPVTFQPAYPGLRQAILLAVTNGGTLRFGFSGTGLAAQVALTPGTLSTAAGTGVSGSSGNNSAAASATLNQPSRATVDSQGNIFIADTGNNAVREVVASTGNIILIAGNGTACVIPTATCGDGGAATSANLSSPASVALDAAEDIFIADSGDNRIRKVDGVTGIITTVAGSGGSVYSGDGGPATSASIGSPQQVLVDTAGNLYLVAAADNAVRYVSAASDIITTLAGTGTVCVSPTAPCGDGAAATAAQLNAPTGIARDAAGDIYIADSGDNRVRRIDASTRQISTVAGTGTAGYAGDNGAPASAELNGVHGIDIDAGGNLYLADQGNSAVRMVLAANNVIGTIVGNGTACGSATATCGDGGLSTGPYLISPRSVSLDSLGNLYTADSGENRIRMVSVAQPTFYFGTVTAGFPGPDNPESVLLANIGNQPLNAVIPSSGTNPAFTTGFSYDTESSTCPLLTPASSPAVLPAGAGCVYAIDYLPVAAGNISGSMTLTDNALNQASATQSVLLTGTATQIYEADTLSSSNTAPAYGTPVTFTDTIPLIDGIVPTGTVSFYNGMILLGSAPVSSSGVAAFTIDSLPVGTDNITAVYNGDTTYASEPSNAVAETVGNPATTATTVALTSSATPSTYGQSTTLTATLSYPNSGAVPTGSVTFYAPGASTAINLQATPTTTTASETLNLAAGTYSVSILGNTGSGLYAGWNPANNPATNDRWTDRYGIELCATCTSLVNDIANDPGYATDAQALAAFQAVATLNMTVNSTVQGQTVANPYTFTLTSPESVSFYLPDGTFVDGAFTNTSSFADDSGGLSLSLTPLTAIGTGTVSSSGVATFTTSALPIGTDPIQAVYSGDITYVGSSSSVLNQVVNKAAGAGTLTSSNAAPVLGQSVTFTDTIPAANGVYPSGSVSFYNGSTLLGTGTLTNGVASLTTSALPVGSDAITALYAGDTTFAAGTSNAVTETVGKSSSADTLTSSNTSPAFGQSVTFTDTIPIVAGIAPTGTVTFYSGTTAIGTGTVNSSGVATLTTGSLPAGTDSITAIYSGDSNYVSITSNAVTVTVAPAFAASSSILTASASATALGQAITFTDTVSGGAQTSPTGTVTFFDGTTLLGTGTVNAAGVATLTTSALGLGTHSITAAYSGDSVYAPSTSNATAVTVTPGDFTIVATPTNQSVDPGGTVSYTVMLGGLTAPFNQPVVLSASGLPPGANVRFTPGTLIPGAGPTPATMTIATSPLQAGLTRSGSARAIGYGILLLPLLGAGKLRKALRRLPHGGRLTFSMLLMAGALAGMTAITGCGSDGYFGKPPHPYTITVTGTSGNLQHATSVTLTVR